MSRDLMTLQHPDAATALREISQDRLGFMQRCRQQYEGMVPLKFDDEMYCLLNHHDYIADVLKDRTSFIKAKDLQQLSNLVGNSLLTNEGGFWQRQRRLAQPVFHQK
ncbi:MAG: cytochrome P450 [Cyanobacteria bacterium P01_H01_bin.105]